MKYTTLIWHEARISSPIWFSAWFNWNPAAIRLPAFIAVHSWSHLGTGSSDHCRSDNRIIYAERNFPFWDQFWAWLRIRLLLIALFQKDRKNNRFRQITLIKMRFYRVKRFIDATVSIASTNGHFYSLGSEVNISFNKQLLSMLPPPLTVFKM